MRFLERFLHLSFVIMTLFAHLGAAVTPLRPTPKTYKYEPQVTTLKGILRSRVYPGPPGYESVKGGDEVEDVWFIRLSQPISVDGDKDPTSFNEKETGVKEVQVIFKDGEEKVLKKQMGKPIECTGTLFHAHMGSHHLDLLMEVQSYRVDKSLRE
jgi:hypothetical protein